MKALAAPSDGGASEAICDYCGLPLSGPEMPGERAYCCYGCRFADSLAISSPVERETWGPASAFGFSVFFTMNVVMLTMALWSYVGADPTPFERALRGFLTYGALAFSLGVLLLLGRPLVSHAIAGLRQKRFTADLLLATGVLATFAVSIRNTLRGEGPVYYEVGCVILVLVTLGRWLEAVGRSQASRTLDRLERLIPDVTRRWVSGKDVMTPRENLVVGDLVHVLAGERVPVDGRVWRGRGVVDEQFFTGESSPVEKQPGDPLLGGSSNLDGDFIIETTSPPSAGALGRLVEAVRAARRIKGRYQRLSDRWSRRFFPIIAVVALCAFFAHGLRVGWEYGLLTGLSVVLIACPCALALATPLAVWTALGTAAKRGVVFRSGAALENLASVRAIRWDKTGTLTTGSPRVSRFLLENVSDRSEVVRRVVLLTRGSSHVFSQAIREFLETDDVSVPGDDFEVRTIPGRGIEGVTKEGESLVLGSVRWLFESGLTWGPCLSKALEEPGVTAHSSLTAIGYAGRAQGLFLLEEAARPETNDALNAFRDLGWDQAVLTGDRHERAAAWAEVWGVPVLAELTPEEKLAEIREAHRRFGAVAMVGDGLNDAPALAAADVGFALGCGADVCRDSADVCLLSADPRLVPWAAQFSRRVAKTIRANLAWSFGYNGLGVVLAASGNLHPAVAAGLMVLSSLMVLGNSSRLSRDGAFSTDPTPDPDRHENSGRPRSASEFVDVATEAAS